MTELTREQLQSLRALQNQSNELRIDPERAFFRRVLALDMLPGVPFPSAEASRAMLAANHLQLADSITTVDQGLSLLKEIGRVGVEKPSKELEERGIAIAQCVERLALKRP